MSERIEPLFASLESHRPVDHRERRYRDEMRELLRAGGNPFSRRSYRPGHFTSGAFVLSPDRAALLMIHHARLSRWLQPGGHVEPGDEDLFAAALREVAEESAIEAPATETGFPGIFDLDIHAIPAGRDEPAHHHFDVRFLLRSPVWTISAGDGVNEIRWVPLNEAGRLNREPAMVRVLAKLRTG